MRIAAFFLSGIALRRAARALRANPRVGLAGAALAALGGIAALALVVAVTPPPAPPEAPHPVMARAPGMETAAMPLSVAPVLRADLVPARAPTPPAFANLRPDALPGLGRVPAPAQPWQHRPTTVAEAQATPSPHPTTIAPAPATRLATAMPRPEARPRMRPAALALAAASPQAAPQSRAQGLATALRPRARPARLAARRDSPVRTATAPQDTPAPQAPAAQVRQVAAVAPVAPQTPTLQLGARRGENCDRRVHVRAMPRRSRGAAPGSTVLASLAGIEGNRRDATLAAQVLDGNVPGFLRQLAPVTFTGRMADGTAARVTLCVTPDYLAVGDARDFVRVPLGLRAATRIAQGFDMMLPTARMVDAIYGNAQLRLPPRPMEPGPQMTSTAYLLRHNATVEAQRTSAGAPAGTLIAGHKKDLVLTSRITRRQGRVAIYGWHRPGGNPIQPLSTVHGAGYADYSHGIRLVSKTAYVNGRAVDLRQMLADGRYASLVSKEGPIGGPRLLMASLAGN